MTLGTPYEEGHRVRVGSVFLIVGIFMVAWAWGNWIYRTAKARDAAAQYRATEAVRDSADSEAASERPARGPRLATQPKERQVAVLKSAAFALVAALGAFLVVLVGSYAIVRGARQYRRLAALERAAPTEAIDVWSMQKPPADFEPTSEEEADRDDSFGPPEDDRGQPA